MAKGEGKNTPKDIYDIFEQHRTRQAKMKADIGRIINIDTGTGDLAEILTEFRTIMSRTKDGLSAMLAHITPAQQYILESGKKSAALKAMYKQASDTIKSIVSQGPFTRGEAFKKAGLMIYRLLSSGSKLAEDLAVGIAGVSMSVVTFLNKKVSQAMGSISGAFTAITSTVTDAMRAIGGPNTLVGKAANMADSIMQNFINAAMVLFRDTLAIRKTIQAAKVQAGTPAVGGSGVVREMRGMMWGLGRDAAQKWATSLIDVGVVAESKVLPEIVRVGLATGQSTSQVMEGYSKMLALTNNANEAATMLHDTFRAAGAAAKGTHLPVKELAKWIQTAGANSRFLNIDMKGVSATLQMMTSDQEKLNAMGISMRLHGKKILEDLTSGANKATDALHVFYGTKGGTSGLSAMEGWVESKFGAGASTTLKATAGGGFEMEKASGTQMLAQRLEVMKKTMMDAAKGASTDSEKLYIQMKVAQETFGMSEETARLMAGKDLDEMKKIAENPKLAQKFDNTRKLMRDLRGINERQEQIQRALANMSMNQVDMLISAVGFLSTIAAAGVLTAAEAVEIPTDEGAMAELKTYLQTKSVGFMTNMGKSVENMVKQFDVVTSVLGGVIPEATKRSLAKLREDISGGRKGIISSIVGGTGSRSGSESSNASGDYYGGYLPQLAVGGSLGYGAVVNEWGKFESILGGLGTAVEKEGMLLLAPGNRRVVSHRDTMEKINKMTESIIEDVISSEYKDQFSGILASTLSSAAAGFTGSPVIKMEVPETPKTAVTTTKTGGSVNININISGYTSPEEVGNMITDLMLKNVGTV